VKSASINGELSRSLNGSAFRPLPGSAAVLGAPPRLGMAAIEVPAGRSAPSATLLAEPGNRSSRSATIATRCRRGDTDVVPGGASRGCAGPRGLEFPVRPTRRASPARWAWASRDHRKAAHGGRPARVRHRPVRRPAMGRRPGAGTWVTRPRSSSAHAGRCRRRPASARGVPTAPGQRGPGGRRRALGPAAGVMAVSGTGLAGLTCPHDAGGGWWRGPWRSWPAGSGSSCCSEPAGSGGSPPGHCPAPPGPGATVWRLPRQDGASEGPAS
jgi:hypothetical protein